MKHDIRMNRKNLYYALIWGILAAITAQLHFNIPGTPTAVTDPREIFTIVGIAFVTRWEYALLIGLLAALGGPVPGLPNTLFIHIVGIPIVWFSYHRLFNKITKQFYFVVAWIAFIVLVMLPIFSSLYTIGAKTLGYHTPDNYWVVFKTFFMGTRFELIIDAFISALALVIFRMERQHREELKAKNQELESVINELTASKTQLQSIQDAVPMAIILHNSHGEIYSNNLTTSKLFGYDPRELISLNVDSLFQPDIIPVILSKISQSTSFPAQGDFEWTGRKKNGNLFPVYIRFRMVRLNNNDYVLSAISDISKRKHAEEIIQKQELQYKNLIEQAQDGIIITENSGVILKANSSAKKMFRRSEPEGLLIYELLPRKSSGQGGIRTEISRSNPSLIELKMEYPDGDFSLLEVSAKTIEENHVLWVFRDITDRKLMENRLQKSQKLETIGRLAGGIAHDFNNLLTVIRGYSEILLLKTLHDDKIHKKIIEIDKAAERAENLTRQLLTYSRKQVIKPKILNLNAILENISKMLQRLIGEDIHLSLKLEDGLKNIRIDPTQIEQVIMNLVINARDAMNTGGELTIETKTDIIKENRPTKDGILYAGEYCVLSISDTGIGIPSDKLDHIFEPFYTTKEIGKGTGLGLATVYGIVHQANANIFVFSEPGKGTTFKIYFSTALDETQHIETKPKVSPISIKGNESILLVEDEKDVREMLKNALEDNGYTVIEAENGAIAADLFTKNKTKPNLIITDVVMPIMNGHQLIQEIRKQSDSMKFIYMSGYTDDIISEKGVLDPNIYFIQKPFTSIEILRKIRTVLDE